VALAVWAWLKRKNPEDNPLLLKAMLLAIPLPYIALQAGWIVTEVGRQPWIVYNLMRTKDAVSPMAASQVGFSFAAMVLLYTVLGLAGFFLIIQHIRRGPEAAPVPVHD
jgi:cytochrome d ubiquinol oxidase subunit I